MSSIRSLMQPEYVKTGAFIFLPGAPILGFYADESSVTIAGQGFRRESYELVQLLERRFDRGPWAGKLQVVGVYGE